MSDRFVTLIGAEEITRAAGRIVQAAADIQHAADHMEAALERHAQRLAEISDEWINRLEGKELQDG